MCGSKGGSSLPAAVDPKVERQVAADDAQVAANTENAAARKLRQQQSLLATGAGNAAATAAGGSLMAQGKQKLGA